MQCLCSANCSHLKTRKYEACLNLSAREMSVKGPLQQTQKETLSVGTGNISYGVTLGRIVLVHKKVLVLVL